MNKRVKYKEPKSYLTPAMKKAYENSLKQQKEAAKNSSTAKKK